MKLIALAAATAAAAAATTCAAGWTRPAEPPRPLVLFVHGRGQLGADTAVLRRQWEADIDSGLVAAGEPALRDEDVRLAWYADVLDPESETQCVLLSGQSDTLDISLASFARAFFDNAVLDSASAGARDARNVLSDVFYVMDPEKRCAAEQRLAHAIDSVATSRPVVVVAYSLGSVVTYDYLRTAAPNVLRNVQLITIGSPIGVSLLRELLLDDSVLSAPAALGSWVNVYDPGDVFAAPLGVWGDTERIRDREVSHPDTAAPHELAHYLRDPTTIDALRRDLHPSS